MRHKHIKFFLIAFPALAFTAHGWLWVFGLANPFSDAQNILGSLMTFVNYIVALFATYGDFF
jgi:hypothetical protein